jgi:hypothetical protein
MATANRFPSVSVRSASPRWLTGDCRRSWGRRYSRPITITSSTAGRRCCLTALAWSSCLRASACPLAPRGGSRGAGSPLIGLAVVRGRAPSMPQWYGIVETGSPPLLQPCNGDEPCVRRTIMEKYAGGRERRLHHLASRQGPREGHRRGKDPDAYDYLATTLEASDPVELEVSRPDR